MFIVSNRKIDELRRSGIRFRTLMPLLRSSHCFSLITINIGLLRSRALLRSASARLEPGAPGIDHP